MHQFICQSCLDLELLLFEGFPLVLCPGRVQTMETGVPAHVVAPCRCSRQLGGSGGGSAPYLGFSVGSPETF